MADRLKLESIVFMKARRNILLKCDMRCIKKEVLLFAMVKGQKEYWRIIQEEIFYRQ